MWLIARGLFLGDQMSAHDRDLLLGQGVTHILNCADEIRCFYPHDFRYYHLRLADPDPGFQDHIEKLCRFIHRGRKSGGVLVHCAAGVSRSPSAIVAYLCWRGKTVEQALDLLSRRVGESSDQLISPHGGFLDQIEVFFEEYADRE